ncbi:hypothetical protein GCM10010530_18320 [Kribbella aluminosa]
MTSDLQQAFVGLLQCSVVTRDACPQLWPLVFAHRSTLADWFVNRLGYRLLLTESAARLYRLPTDAKVHAPRPTDMPGRRALILAVLTAAAAEDAEDVTSTQELSDRVRVLTDREQTGVTPYDPDRYTERVLFVRGLQVLVDLGGLRPLGVATTDQNDDWARQRNKVGDAFDVRRELLLRMIDPVSLNAALDSAGGQEAESPRFGVLRRLLELPVCYFADLSDDERAYLTNQRRRLLSWCEEMTGWTAEERAEGIALVVTEDKHTDLPFPRLRAADFCTLLILDELLGDIGTGKPFGRDRIELAADDIADRYPTAMTAGTTVQGAMAAGALETLAALDLLRPAETPGEFHLTPAAARYRGPAVQETTDRSDGGTDD